MSDLPELLYKDKNGHERRWKIWSVDDVLYTASGLTTGKLVFSSKIITGKNIGKKNETTGIQQALLEAERKWIKKLSLDVYGSDEISNKRIQEMKNIKRQNCGSNLQTVMFMENNASLEKKIKKQDNLKIEGIDLVKPMLADKFSKEVKCLKYFGDEIYVQPKLDGIRCLALYKEGNVVLYSRQLKQFPWFSNIRNELLIFFEMLEDFKENIIFDGELITDKVVNSKGEITSDSGDIFSGLLSSTNIMRNKSNKELEDIMEYHIFDIIYPENQKERFRLLKSFFALLENSSVSKIKKVPTTKIKDFEEIDSLLDFYIAEKYEGLIIRDSALKYESGRRSLKLRKYKLDEELEVEIQGISLKEKADPKTFVWICSIPGKENFKVTPTGTHEDRISIYNDFLENPDNYVGKLLTIRYQNLTNHGIPRFARAITIRDYE